MDTGGNTTKGEDASYSIFDILPDEMIIRIVEYCDVRTIFSLKRTCRFFYEVTKSIIIRGRSLPELLNIVKHGNTQSIRESIIYAFIPDLLAMAIKIRRIDMVRLLLEYHPPITKEVLSAFVQYANASIFRVMLSHLSEFKKGEALLQATASNKIELATWLLESLAHKTPFHEHHYLYSYLLSCIQSFGSFPIDSAFINASLPKLNWATSVRRAAEVRSTTLLIRIVKGLAPISALYSDTVLWDLLSVPERRNIPSLIRNIGADRMARFIQKYISVFTKRYYLTRLMYEEACKLGHWDLISSLLKPLKKQYINKGIAILIQRKHLDVAFELIEKLVGKNLITPDNALRIVCKEGSLSLLQLVETRYQCKRRDFFRSTAINLPLLKYIANRGTAYISFAFTRACQSGDRKCALFLLNIILRERVPKSITRTSRAQYTIIDQMNYYQFSDPIAELYVTESDSSDRTVIYIRSNKLNPTNALEAACSINDIEMATFLKDVHSCDYIPSLTKSIKSVEMAMLLLKDIFTYKATNLHRETVHMILNSSKSTSPLILRALVRLKPTLAIEYFSKCLDQMLLSDDDRLLREILELDPSLDMMELLYDGVVFTAIRIVRYLVSSPIRASTDEWEDCASKLKTYDWADAITRRKKFLVRLNQLNKYISNSNYVPTILKKSIYDHKSITTRVQFILKGKRL